MTILGEPATGRPHVGFVGIGRESERGERIAHRSSVTQLGVPLPQVPRLERIGDGDAAAERPPFLHDARLDLFEHGCGLNGGAGGHRLVGVADHDRQVDQPGEHTTERCALREAADEHDPSVDDGV